jgi:VWFA-related protein
MTELSRRQWMMAWLAAPALRLAAQQGTTFSTDVNVVNVLATVRNKQGEIVRNLTKTDFSIEEDGHPLTIQYFAQEFNLPLTLGLLVDTSGSMRQALTEERSASFTFLQRVLREDRDLAFVIHFDREVELLQELTSSREKLEKSLDLLQAEQPQLQRGGSGGGGGYPGGRGNPPAGGRRGTGGTVLYDAVDLAAEDLMKKQAGRKALIVLSDGVDTGSKLTLPAAVAAAQRNDTLVYTILFAGSGSNSRPMGGFGGPGRRRGGMGGPPMGGRGPQGASHADGKKILQQIARETGGGFFEVSKKMPVSKVYERIQDELRSQYNLGYTSGQPGTGYRTIHVAAKDKKLIVQARTGYYAR